MMVQLISSTEVASCNYNFIIIMTINNLSIIYKRSMDTYLNIRES
jgi:hypothetical protein